jgi:AraC-like DNA-binding protein
MGKNHINNKKPEPDNKIMQSEHRYKEDKVNESANPVSGGLIQVNNFNLSDSLIKMDHINIVDMDYTPCDEGWMVNDTPLYYRMYFVEGGDVTYTDSTTSFQLKANYFYIFPINKPYKIVHKTADPLVHLWFHVNLTGYFITEPIALDLSENMECFHLLMSIKEIIKKRSKSINLDSLVEFLIRYINDLLKPYKIYDERIILAVGYIRQYYDRNISDEELSALVYLNKSYFIKLFKKILGVTPQKFIAMYKLNLADHLLRNGASVKETAFRTGFQDVKAFSKFYKKNKEIQPSRVKKVFYLLP